MVEAFKITYTNGGNYKENSSYELSFKLKCVKEIGDNQKINVTSLEIDENKFTFEANSPYVCLLFQISPFYNFFLECLHIIKFLMLIIGIIECFFGLCLLAPTLFHSPTGWNSFKGLAIFCTPLISSLL